MIAAGDAVNRGLPRLPENERTAAVELDDTICYCFHISKRKIINYIRLHQPRVPSQVSECGGAGTGCGWCVPFLKKYFAQETRQTADDDRMTPDEYARARGAYLRSGGGRPPAGAIPPPDEADA